MPRKNLRNIKRPRVATIGLSNIQQDSITHLCGQLRSAESLEGYLEDFSWSETDIMVAQDLKGEMVDANVNLLIIGPHSLNLARIELRRGYEAR